MNNSPTLINVNYIFNWLTLLSCIFNFGWVIEMVINSIVQYRDLQELAVNNDNKPVWKAPLVILTILSGLTAVIIILISLGIPKTIYSYIAVLLMLMIQLFFAIDYAHVLNKILIESWYATSSYVLVGINIVALISTIVFVITAIATTGVGI